MSESIDWEAYYQKESALSDFNPQADRSEAFRCEAAWSVFPRGEIESILDVGCGDGYFCHWVAGRAKAGRVVGCDVSKPRLERAAERYPEVRYVWGKIPELPFEDDAFEVVTCIEVLEHLAEPAETLRELKRIARKHVIVTVPDRRPVRTTLCPHCLKTFPTDGHLRMYDPASLSRELADAGLTVEKLKVYHVPAYAFRALPFRLLGRCRRRLKALVSPNSRGKYLAARAAVG
jgi:2-polyprenyl-6-hydroxyphenyl methylase/3-demethylubiquinone-9 3-methyltransferase